MTRPARWAGAAVIALVATGCIKWGTRPPLERYVIAMPAAHNGASVPREPPVLAGTLAIVPYVTRGIYDDRGIVYRLDDLQLESYPNREWAIPLREQLGTATAEILAGRPLTSEPATFDSRSQRSYAYVWRGTVREFEEVNRGTDVFAAVHLDVQIVRTANDSVVWSGSERIERAVPEPTTSMTRVVETLSAVTADVLSALIGRARSELAVPAAEAARLPR